MNFVDWKEYHDTIAEIKYARSMCGILDTIIYDQSTQLYADTTLLSETLETWQCELTSLYHRMDDICKKLTIC